MLAHRDQTLRIRFDAFELNEADARLRCNGTPIPLAPKAFAVLCTLARKPGVLVTKSDLLDAVWGHQHVSESVLKTIISELRSALADDARQPRYIETAARRGYRFIADAEPTAPGATTRASVSAAPATAAPQLPWPASAAPTAAAFAPTATAAPAPVPNTTPIPSLIGRQSPLARLRAAWSRAQSGDRQLIWIAGDAGVGKSTLIKRFVSELPPGAAVYGQCIEHFGTGEPYLPILEAMAELCRRAPELAGTLRAVAPTWLLQLPWLLSEPERAELHREVAGAHVERMVREMRELMDRYTANRPLVFVLEDMHWSDDGTLRMMEHFARRPRSVKVLWIASFRLTQVIAEEHPLRDLRQELRLHRLCDEILLEPFSESEVADYMQDRLPESHLPEAFVRRLHSHTEGLPLFVANIAETLLADPQLLGSWLQADSRSPLPVPDSLSGAIEKQIARLDGDVQSLLQAAAVCGVEFRVSTVAHAIDRDSSWVSAQCDELVQRQFWLKHVDIVEMPDGSIDTRYSFVHALYRYVFYQRLSVPRRIELHRRVAKSIQGAQGPFSVAAELASHFERGHQPMLAVRYYAEAAANAVIRHFAPVDAINLTTAGIKLLDRVPDSPQRMELELALVHQRGIACAQAQGIASPESIAAFDRARVLCDALPESPERSLLLNGIGLTCYIRGDYPGAIAIADRASERAERLNSPLLRLQSCMLRGLAFAMQAKYTAARERLEEGIQAYRELNEDRIPFASFVSHPLVTLQSYLAFVLMHVGYADQARSMIRAARAQADLIRQPMARMVAYWNEALIAICTEDIETVAVNAEQLRVITEATMLRQFEGPAKWLQGWVAARKGSPGAAYQTIREGFEIHAQRGRYHGNTEMLNSGAEALLMAGDLAGARAQLDEAEALAERIGERFELPNIRLVRARVVLAEGDRQGAVTLMRSALNTAREQQARYFELQALVALCSLDNPAPHDLNELCTMHANLQEGLDLPLVRRAAALIR